jgi:hypothetical protein
VPDETRRTGRPCLFPGLSVSRRYWNEWMTIMPSPYNRSGASRSIRTKQGGGMRTVKTKTIGRRLIYWQRITTTIAVCGPVTMQSGYIHSALARLECREASIRSLLHYSRTRIAGPKGNMPPDDSMGQTTINSTRPHQHLCHLLSSPADAATITTT